MGGQPGGGYGYGQQGYYQGGYQQGYDQGYSQNGWQQGDFGFGFDPFGFGFGFGGYQQQSGASYSGSDSPEMQAARNFVANGRYAEARRVLDGMNSRSARCTTSPRWPIRARQQHRRAAGRPPRRSAGPQ